MMNRHDPQRDPALAFLPGHPMRDGPHLDRSQHGRPQLAPHEQALHAADRLVVAHVLVDRQRDACTAAQLDDLFCLP